MKVIGLMSGTSVDGIDAALVEVAGAKDDLQISLIAGETYPYPEVLQAEILAVCGGAARSMAEFAELDDAIAAEFAQAALHLQAHHPKANLIGSHGQTIFHRPPTDRLGYTVQLGRGDAIALQTGITTVSNFRVADIAAGGQGAPLVSALDAALLTQPTHHRCVQNIGGIGNVTYLPAANSPFQICGWDTGPGNMLIDLAVQHFTNGTQTYDRDGAWAATGTPCQTLVDRWLNQAFFHQAPPKSTGREHFGQEYFNQCLLDAEPYHLSPADVLATLTELTAASIAYSYRSFLPKLPDQVLVCGGGSRNSYLRTRLQARLGNIPVIPTDDVGLSADFKEAIAFAVLAYWRYHEIPGNLPEVTGAKKSVLLGEIHHVA